tara:strand:- start:56 stop:235 length:180 start_codon:yes stop_codon:yes gene_type:complete
MVFFDIFKYIIKYILKIDILAKTNEFNADFTEIINDVFMQHMLKIKPYNKKIQQYLWCF